MKTRRSIAVGLLALSAGAAALPALAGDDCDVPTQRWQSREAVRQMAAQKGWELERLKINDGCWEIRGRDAEGRRFLEVAEDPRDFWHPHRYLDMGPSFGAALAPFELR